MQIRIIPNPSQAMLDSLVELEDDIIPPFYQRCAIADLPQGVRCLVMMPRETQCRLGDEELVYKGAPTPAAERHRVKRIQPDDTVSAGNCVIICYRKDGRVYCGLMDPEFCLPKGAQLYQVASDGVLDMIDLVNAAAVK